MEESNATYSPFYLPVTVMISLTDLLQRFAVPLIESGPRPDLTALPFAAPASRSCRDGLHQGRRRAAVS